MRVSTVIPTYNSEKTLAHCLLSVQKQSYSPNEMIIVDGGSVDGTIEIINNFKNIKLVHSKEDTPGSARNRGTEKASGDILFFCDSDCIVDQHALAYHMQAYQRRGDIVGVMGSIRRANLKTNISAYIQRQMMISEWTSNLHKDGTVSSYLNTANLTLNREIVLENRFREDLVSSEDVEFFIRLKQKGLKILYEPRAVAYHHHPTTIEQLFLRFMGYGQGFMQIENIHGKEARNRYRILSPVRYLDFSEDYLKDAVFIDNRLLCRGCVFDKLQKCKIQNTQVLKKQSTTEVDLHRAICLALAAGILKQRIDIDYELTMRDHLKDQTK